MAITVNWLNPSQNIIVWEFGATWTWDEFYATRERSNRMLAQVVHQVAVVVDMRSVESFPRGIMTHAINAVMARPANSGMTVMLVQNAALRVLYNSFMLMVPRLFPGGTFDLLLAEDIDSAVRLIHDSHVAS